MSHSNETSRRGFLALATAAASVLVTDACASPAIVSTKGQIMTSPKNRARQLFKPEHRLGLVVDPDQQILVRAQVVEWLHTCLRKQVLKCCCLKPDRCTIHARM